MAKMNPGRRYRCTNVQQVSNQNFRALKDWLKKTGTHHGNLSNKHKCLLNHWKISPVLQQYQQKNQGDTNFAFNPLSSIVGALLTEFSLLHHGKTQKRQREVRRGTNAKFLKMATR
ncbi:hypothetical protein DQ04_02101030 [Trypanosoma grayi]|uniref:hypothetical protein n=1 Tax=Trypanosoma grayi TaxID=71804 RepID=UPI0004F4A27F|nr:hypothetical protein DQ04_02101030 [Trypanosoma grayi]KEG11969.1 hypothetical protein DQ04_02101030 [Trypanosoma grayi]